MNKPKVYASDRLYIPAKLVYDKDTLRDTYTLRSYEEAACRKCEYRHDRHSYLCDQCPAFLSVTRLYERVERDGKFYYAIPIGDRRKLKHYLNCDTSEIQLVDQRTRAPFEYEWKFTLDLWPYQNKVVEDFMRYRYGLVESPPRSGKTAMTLKIVNLLGQRAVILADQHDFLTQFEYHIEGHKASNIPKCTNLPELQDKYGVKLYGTPKTPEDWNTIQIFFFTYQTFLSETAGAARLKKLNRRVGTLAVDEVHSSAAECYSQVVASLQCKHKSGFSGTMDRKDGRDWIIKKTIGPIVARCDVEALIPTVYVHPTEFKTKARYQGRAGFVKAMQALARDKKRNKQIIAQVVKDIKNGESVMIPALFTKHIRELQKGINDAMEEQVCDIFVGGAKEKARRKEVLNKAKSGKIKCVIGIRRLMQRGLNVPAWSVAYTIMPISNSPNYKQETARVRTPHGNKKPKVRLFVDEGLGVSIGCAKHCIKDFRTWKFKFSKLGSQVEIVNRVMGTSRSSNRSDELDEQFSLSLLGV